MPEENRMGDRKGGFEGGADGKLWAFGLIQPKHGLRVVPGCQGMPEPLSVRSFVPDARIRVLPVIAAGVTGAGLWVSYAIRPMSFIDLEI